MTGRDQGVVAPARLWLRPVWLLLVAGLATVPTACTPTEEVAERAGPRKPDVIYVPTPHEVVEKMLDVAGVTSDDVVYDLGCGDGRIVVAAAKRGARARGFEIRPELVEEARENIEAAGVADLASVEQADIFTIDLTPATVIALYLLPEVNLKLIPQFEKLAPGARIVSHDFGVGNLATDEVASIEGPERVHEILLWRAPLRTQKQK